jgi:hypothetical protein
MTPLFERDDWMLFRTLGTIGQKAGAELNRLRRLVLKELADNALDAGGNCRVDEIRRGVYVVEDDGPGLPGGPDDVAKLFSIRRPLTSSKLLRRPTRGAVGNGLRVVAGAVLASGGKLTVFTQNRVHHLTPQDDGTTAVEWQEADYPTGTRIEIEFGELLPEDDDDDALAWARQAIAFGNDNVYGGAGRKGGKSSAYWFDGDAFHELCQSAGDLTVRKLVEELAGCAGRKAGKLAANFQGRRASELSRSETAALLLAVRKESTRVSAKRLGRVGKKLGGCYACEKGCFEKRAGRGGLSAEIPFIVEAWATPHKRPQLTMAVNRTPIASDLAMYRDSSDKNNYTLYGCGLFTEFPVGQPRRGDFKLTVNVTTPYMPITTDGKTPDLSVVEDELVEALGKAVRKAKRRNKSAGGKGQFQIAFIRKHLDDAIRHAGGENNRYSLRTLFYSFRHIHKKVGATCDVPTWDWFGKVITKIENELGHDLPRMTRDDRGFLYHPHTGEFIPLGTRNVEDYRRPEWLFHKALYIEKQGLVEILIDDGWPERNDCALLTSNGQPTRAVRDLLDLLGDTGEPLTIFGLHDGDAYGTGIYQALTEATEARSARKVKVINLGLEPWEGVELGLQIEPAEKCERKHPVASYVAEKSEKWVEWLQEWRVELNAMPTPDFIAWLDRKIADHGGETKLVPPEKVLRHRLTEHARQKIRDRLVAAAIEEARVDERTETELKSVVARMEALDGDLVDSVQQALADNPDQLWTRPVEAVAESLVSAACVEKLTKIAR